MKLNHLIPMLNVTNIRQSLDFYEKALGFEIVSDPKVVDDWRWATIRSGATELMLAECESPPELPKCIDPQQNTNWPAIYYFYPDDVEALFSHILALGYRTTGLAVTCYGMNEFSMQDPDGHTLSFGQEVESDSVS